MQCVILIPPPTDIPNGPIHSVLSSVITSRGQTRTGPQALVISPIPMCVTAKLISSPPPDSQPKSQCAIIGFTCNLSQEDTTVSVRTKGIPIARRWLIFIGLPPEPPAIGPLRTCPPAT